MVVDSDRNQILYSLAAPVKHILLGVLFILPASRVDAEAKLPWQEYSKQISSSQNINTLPATIFGDSVNLYTGAVEFSAVDISVAGNNQLPVQISRSHPSDSGVKNLPFGDWDMNLPYVGGTFAKNPGWVLAKGKEKRCSSVSSIATAQPADGIGGVDGQVIKFKPENYWSGYKLSQGSGGEEDLLIDLALLPKPQGVNSPWVTKSLSYLSCLPTLKSGQVGEGFLVHSPNGMKYYLDWMVSRVGVDILRPVLSNKTPQALNARLLRDEIRIYPSRVEDSFGNWVSYAWTGSRLDSITSNDGRKISINWEVNSRGDDRVRSVISGDGRAWTYFYTDYNQLASVKLPDGSEWRYELAAHNALPTYDETYSEHRGGQGIYVHDRALGCSWMRVLKPVVSTAKVRHPSGAWAEFDFQTIRNGKNDVDIDCINPDETLNGNNVPDNVPEDLISAWIPARFDTNSIVAKRVSGPGLVTKEWKYSYNPVVGCWKGFCQGGRSTKTTDLVEPNGVRSVYTYGVVVGQNEGQLLAFETSSSGIRLKQESFTYVSTEDVQTGVPFPDQIGLSPNTRSEPFSAERLRPKRGQSTDQDGIVFSSRTQLFDRLARPVSVLKSSTLGYSRLENSGYFDHPQKWVLGLPLFSKQGDTEISHVDYDGITAQPLRIYSFGVLEQALSYHADGTVKTVADGNGHVTTLSNWKRGTPQLIQHADETKESAVVNDAGWVQAVTDALGSTTRYEYDAMGRLILIDRPDGDSVNWTNTVLGFDIVNAEEYGISAGHWRHTEITGNHRKTKYFDALFRPLVEREEDISDPATVRVTAKRYDYAGQVTDEYYARTGTVMRHDQFLDGVHMQYDGLGRLTQSVQNSESGPLITTIEYLSGFKRKTTNPRKHSTVESFMAFDVPVYDSPVLIDSPEGSITSIKRNEFGKPVELTRKAK